MIKRDLKDNFQISISGQDTWYDMNVPGSAMETFCKEGILPDPYYGMNEYKWTEFWKNDFDIRSTFSVSAEEIASEEILLTFYGIDTVADVFLNGKKLGHTENMHRTWVYQVKELVKEGENLLELCIASLKRRFCIHRNSIIRMFNSILYLKNLFFERIIVKSQKNLQKFVILHNFN